MLLKSIQASNFMKYKRLEISDLQDKVFIGIFGDNESGKSTIGEVVSFALFGSPVRFPKENLTQLINWEAESCEARVTFRIEGDEYTVVRYIDQSNEHRAALYKANQATPIIKGAYAVTREIEELTKFNFENFRYSFYLAQKEINILKEKRVNTREILHKMLGFDCMEKACDILKQEIQNLQIRLEKLEKELETHQNLLKNIKADSNLERSLHKQLEELKKQKKQAQEDFDKNEQELIQYQEMIESHCKMSSCFNILEISIFCQFYKEKLNHSLEELSEIYGILREEKKSIEKKQKNKKEEFLKIQEQKKLLEKFSKEIASLETFLAEYHEKIQKQLANIKLAFDKKKKQISYISYLQFISSALAFLFLIFFVFCNFISWNKEQNLFVPSSFYSIEAFYLLLSGIFFFFFCAGIFYFRKKQKNSNMLLKGIFLEIEKWKKEEELSVSFKGKNFSTLKDLQSTENDIIQKKLISLTKEYSDIFQKYSDIQQIQEQIQKEEEKNTEFQKELEQKNARIENLLKTLESLAKGINFAFMPDESKKYYVENMQELEKNIYSLLSQAQEYRTGLQSYEIQNPVEMNKAWQEYEQNRLRFRELSGMNSLGGGTGLFNRLKGALRQKTFEKLSLAIQQEKENFFVTIPTLHKLQEKFNDLQRARWIFQEKLNECLPSLKEIELKTQKCEEDLLYKKDLTNKLQSLLRQGQEIESDKTIHAISLQMMKESLESADKRFGPALARTISKVLPSFTRGRYQKVQVLDDLTIKVFSTEKNDYVDICELSGGAIDQICLALRLAFSQAIMSVKASREWKQFLFFDEPILSFDEKRSDSFLDFLSEYSKNFVQIFMISPRFFPKEFFNLVIQTSLENNILILSGKNTQKINKEYLQEAVKK